MILPKGREEELIKINKNRSNDDSNINTTYHSVKT